LSEKRNSFSELLKNKGLKEEKKAKVGLDAIDTSTTLESNKSRKGNHDEPCAARLCNRSCAWRMGMGDGS
jgi:hypothetical protein